MTQRVLPVSLVLVALVWLGCPTADPPPPATCGRIASFETSADYQACNRASLATRTAGGIWHLASDLDVYSQNATPPAPGALNLTPQADGGLLLGRPITERIEDAETYYVASVYESNGSEIRVGYAGCAADTPDHFTGFYEVCIGDAPIRSGPFEAVRLQRREGELESSGITLTAEVALAGSSSDVFAADGRAYVPRFEGGLTLLDVSVPATPEVRADLGTPDAGGGWLSAAATGNALYVSSTVEGILVYDVTDPTAPTRALKVINGNYSAGALSLFGNVLYAVGPALGQVLRYDVTTPLAPVRTSLFTPPGANPQRGRYPQSVFELESRAYVAANALGLAVIDVTNPAVPTTLGTLPGADSSSRAVAVARYGAQVIAFEGGDGWGGHLRVLDVTDPAHITVVTEVAGREEVAIRALALRGNRLYVANLDDGLRVYDVTTPATPTLLAYFNTWREDDPGRGISFYDGVIGVSVPGDGYVYAAETSRGLMVFPEVP